MESSFPDLLMDRQGTDGRVGRITFNRPETMNSFSQSLLQQFNEVLHDWEADPSIRVIVVRGAGRGFSSGYDMSSQASVSSNGVPVRNYQKADAQGRRLGMNLRTFIQQTTDIQMYFWNMAKVTIAELHGFCLAGGCELAMMADLVVASEDCQIGHPGVRGMGYPRNGAIWPMVMGMRKVKELTFSGDTVSGVDAERMGMINYAWPAAELEQRTIEFADRFANMTADQLAMLKVATNRWYENMGMYSSVRSSTETSVAAQFTAEAYLWQEKVRDSGFKKALEWRDGRYRQSAGKKRDDSGKK